MKSWFKFLFNKYLLAFLFTLVWVIFFDDTDYFTQLQRQNDLKDMIRKIEYYKKEIAIANQELSDIQNNPEALEKFAREKYYMKKDNEDLYIIEYPHP